MGTSTPLLVIHTSFSYYLLHCVFCSVHNHLPSFCFAVQIIIRKCGSVIIVTSNRDGRPVNQILPMLTLWLLFISESEIKQPDMFQLLSVLLFPCAVGDVKPLTIQDCLLVHKQDHSMFSNFEVERKIYILVKVPMCLSTKPYRLSRPQY